MQPPSSQQCCLETRGREVFILAGPCVCVCVCVCVSARVCVSSCSSSHLASLGAYMSYHS